MAKKQSTKTVDESKELLRTARIVEEAQAKALGDPDWKGTGPQQIDTPEKLLALIEQEDVATEMARYAGLSLEKHTFDAIYRRVRKKAIEGGLEPPSPTGDAQHDLLTLRQWCNDPGSQQTPNNGSDTAKTEAQPLVTGPAATAARNRIFLDWYEEAGTETYHKPKRVFDKWESMNQTQRAEACPGCSAKVSRYAVEKGIKLARWDRDGKPVKNKKARQKSRKA